MSDIQTDDFLEHYGVKGMKWGQRKQSQADSLRRVSQGKGSKGDTAKAVAGMKTGEFVRGGGSFKKAAGKKADKIQGKIDKNDAKRTKRDDTRAKANDARTAASAKRNMNSGTKIVADVLLTGGLLTANDIARSAGFSRGKSAGIALVGGLPGALVASELKYRR